jgi:DNA-binding NarL/FixJ family response regulator
MMIRVLLADDHRLVRAGLEQLLSNARDIEVVGAAAGGAEAIEMACRLEPDVVLMDVSMPDVDGIVATRTLRQRRPDLRVVMLTSTSDRDRILDSLDAGAIGYLLKDAEPEQLFGGIRAAARGDSPLDPKAARAMIAGRRPTSVEQAQLTPREQEILRLLVGGHPNKVIGQRLLISEKTVKNHLGRIFQAIGVSDRTQAALWAQRHLVVERGREAA